jgi:hypothetical protein
MILSRTVVIRWNLLDLEGRSRCTILRHCMILSRTVVIRWNLLDLEGRSRCIREYIFASSAVITNKLAIRRQKFFLLLRSEALITLQEHLELFESLVTITFDAPFVFRTTSPVSYGLAFHRYGNIH